MPRDARAYLSDMLESCDAITLAVQGFDRSACRGSRLVRSPVEREFIIIGEALMGLGRASPELFSSIRTAGNPGNSLPSNAFQLMSSLSLRTGMMARDRLTERIR